MKNVPKIGDVAYVSCNGKQIIKCEILSDFTKYIEPIKDEYDIGERKHTTNSTYLHMKILEVYDEPIELKHNQRTWTTYPPKNLN